MHVKGEERKIQMTGSLSDGDEFLVEVKTDNRKNQRPEQE